MKIYLASGFFNPKQVALVEAIEKMAQECGVELYSPRRDGPGNLADMTQGDRDRWAKKVFISNCAAIVRADTVLAVIDDRDVGVIWEMGYAFGSGVTIYSFSNEGFGMNVMMKGCIAGHLIGTESLLPFFRLQPEVHPVVT